MMYLGYYAECIKGNKEIIRSCVNACPNKKCSNYKKCFHDNLNFCAKCGFPLEKLEFKEQSLD